MCMSNFCVDYACWVVLAGWLEPKWMRVVPGAPWETGWPGWSRLVRRLRVVWVWQCPGGLAVLGWGGLGVDGQGLSEAAFQVS